MELGEVIKEYRRINKISMQEFADRCGLSKGYISMLEKGQHPQSKRKLIPSAKTIQQIAKGMNTDINTFVSVLDMDTMIEMNADEIPQDLEVLQQNWEKLSEDDKAIIRFIASKYKG